jgi:uncharacterized protein
MPSAITQGRVCAPAQRRTVWLILIFFGTSAISVVTGSTSLITVPAMLQFHIEPRTTLLQSMFALTFMSIGGAYPFLRSGMGKKRMRALIALTLAGSVNRAFLLLLLPVISSWRLRSPSLSLV